MLMSASCFAAKDTITMSLRVPADNQVQDFSWSNDEYVINVSVKPLEDNERVHICTKLIKYDCCVSRPQFITYWGKDSSVRMTNNMGDELEVMLHIDKAKEAAMNVAVQEDHEDII